MKQRLEWVFVGPGGVRNGWRFAVFVGLWYWLSFSGYGVFPLVLKVYTVSASGFTPPDILVLELANAVVLLAVSALLVRLERHRWSWFGFAFEAGSWKRFAWGCLAGAAMVTALFLACWAGGAASLSGLAVHGGEFWQYLGLWLVGMLCVGLSEELQFRGYAQAALTRGIGFWPAVACISALFGAEHYFFKAMENVPDILNIVLLGLFMAYSVRRTGSLWFAIGFHAAFDFFALGFYGSPNTGTGGQPLEHHLLDTHIAGPAWLTGGPQGLEASWLLVPLTLAAFLLINRLYPEDRYPRD